MKIFEKEIIYKLQSSGFEIYKDNSNDNFLISKHVCSECRCHWYTNKEQCIFCGSLGYNVKICEKMHISLIAGKKETCGVNGCEIKETELVKSCINVDCESNKNQSIKKLIKSLTGSKGKGTGIFSGNSPFCISQSYCFFCGSDKNEFLSKELDIKNSDNQDEVEKINIMFKKDVLIIKSKAGFITKTRNENLKLKFNKSIDVKKIFDLFI